MEELVKRIKEKYIKDQTICIIESFKNKINLKLLLDQLEQFDVILEQPRNKVCVHTLNDKYLYVILGLACNCDKGDKSIISIENIKHITDSDEELSLAISRMGIAEDIKNKTMFVIFYTSSYFQQLAENVRIFLNAKQKLAYLVYLEDVSFERLTCIDNTQVIVLITCPDLYEYQRFHIPVVTPFDVQLAFDEEYNWDGVYKPNRFCVQDFTCIVPFENSYNVLIDEIKRMSFLKVDFENAECDMEIYEGLDGIASEYRQERK